MSTVWQQLQTKVTLQIRVWDMQSGDHDTTLASYGAGITALAARGTRLYSASCDGAVRVWEAGTWEMLLSVQVLTGSG